MYINLTTAGPRQSLSLSLTPFTAVEQPCETLRKEAKQDTAASSQFCYSFYYISRVCDSLEELFKKKKLQ